MNNVQPSHHSDQHPHFQCEQCKQISCIDSLVIPKMELPKGYIQKEITMMVKGICPELSGIDLQMHCMDKPDSFVEKNNENGVLFIPFFTGLFLLSLFPAVLFALEKNRRKPSDFQQNG